MMLKIHFLKAVLISTLILLLNSNVYGSQSEIHNIYLGGGIGYGQTALGKPVGATMFERNGFSWTVFTGYQLTKAFSSEVGYVNMQNVKASGAFSPGVIANDTIEPWFGYIAAKYTLPIHFKYAVFAKGGAAYAQGDDTLQVVNKIQKNDAHEIVAYGALGISYALKSNLSLSFEIASTTKKDMVPRMTLATLGIGYTL